jgi:hypothetical protein
MGQPFLMGMIGVRSLKLYEIQTLDFRYQTFSLISYKGCLSVDR